MSFYLLVSDSDSGHSGIQQNSSFSLFFLVSFEFLVVVKQKTVWHGSLLKRTVA